MKGLTKKIKTKKNGFSKKSLSSNIENYQVLTLIGGIFGIGLSLFLVFLVWSPWYETPGLPPYIAPDVPSESDHLLFIVSLALPIPFYVTSIILAFKLKNTKKLGIILIGISAFTFYQTFFYGIISFLFITSAGIYALRYRNNQNINA